MVTGKRRRLAAVGAGMTLVLATSGCLASSDDGGGSGTTSSGTSGDGKVTIAGAFAGAEETAFEESLTKFADDNDLEIDYTGDGDFTTTIKQRVQAGDSPDIGLFPQPGGLLELSDDMTPIGDIIDLGAVEETLIPGFLEATTKDGNVYGVPMRMAIKSLVWYPKKAYKDGGYDTEPKSIQELQSVAEEIAGDGITPWCMGWGSDQSTGWVGTDWLEELVLRTSGPDVYDQWVSHEIPFDDPQIVAALDEFGKIAKDPEMVLGGPKAVLNTPFAEAGLPSFETPPKCMMERQGNFVTGFYPEDIQSDLDNQVGLFSYPPFEGGFDGQPVLGGGDLAAVFGDPEDEDIAKVMEFIASDQFGAEWAAAGGWLSPHTTFDNSQYADEITRQVAEIGASAEVFRFDGSDLMPKEVGSGTFWSEMVKWESGQSSEDTLAAIEASWPAS